jgi:hypothetical protein
MRGRKRIVNLEVWNEKFKEEGLEKNGLRFIWFFSCWRNKKEICSFCQSKMHEYALATFAGCLLRNSFWGE